MVSCPVFTILIGLSQPRGPGGGAVFGSQPYLNRRGRLCLPPLRPEGLEIIGCHHRVQNPIFKTKISWGIQKWVQTNQLSTPLLMIFSKNYFRHQKSSKKMDVLFIFYFFKLQFLTFWWFLTDPESPAVKFFSELVLHVHTYWQKHSKINKTFNFPRYLVFQKGKVACENKLEFSIFWWFFNRSWEACN